MDEPHVWTPVGLYEEYFRLYGPGEWTTLRVLTAGRGSIRQAERAWGQLVRAHPGAEMEHTSVGNFFVKIGREKP